MYLIQPIITQLCNLNCSDDAPTIIFSLFFLFFVAVGGKWIYFEVLNIPWSVELLDLTSQMFLDAKYIVEKAVSVKRTCRRCFFFLLLLK